MKFLISFIIKFSTKVTVPAIMLLFVVLSGLFTFFQEIDSQYKEEESIKLDEVKRTAGLFQLFLSKTIREGGFVNIHYYISDIIADESLEIVFFADENNSIIVGSRNKFRNENAWDVLGLYIPDTMNLKKKLERAAENGGMVIEVTKDRNTIFSASPVFAGTEKGEIKEKRIGTIFMVYKLERLKENRKVEIIQNILRYSIFYLVLAVLFVITFHYTLTRRFDELIRVTEKFGLDNLSIRANLDGKDELARLKNVFNTMADRISFLINYDSLTGLLNRVSFEAKVGNELLGRKEGLSAVLSINLDKFYDFITTMGYSRSDRIIQVIAERLKEIISSSDSLARMAGDEFIIFIKYVNSIEYLETITSKILMEIAKPIPIGEEYEFQLTACIGIAVYPTDGEEIDSLVKKAEQAVHHAKSLDRNTFTFFNRDFYDRQIHKVTLNQYLKTALLKNEFFLVYQPIVNAPDLKLLGFEVLLRWRNKDLGLIYPGDFIPLLEESGNIKEVTDWILKETCLQILNWEQKGIHNIYISVNLTAQHFLQKYFVDTIKNIIQNSGVSPSALSFEITESQILKYPEVTRSVLKQLREMGVTIAIDDFGTGYSSLSHIKHLPVNYIKIDKSFISDILRDKEDAAIVNTIISLAHSLGMETVAEGVESSDVLKELIKMKCNRIQGYYISEPVLPEEIIRRFFTK